MGKIKTRERVRDIKTLDKAAIAGQRMKDAFVRTRDKAAKQTDEEQTTPVEYAGDQVQGAAGELARDAVCLTGAGVKKAARRGKTAFRNRRSKASEDRMTDIPREDGPVSSVLSDTSRAAEAAPRGRASAKERGKTPVNDRPAAVGQVPQNRRPTARRMVGTVRRVSDAGAKAVKLPPQTADSVCGMGRHRLASRLAAKASAARTASGAQTAAAAVRTAAAQAGTDGGAWILGAGSTILVIVVLCLIGLIAGSCFGIFLSGEDSGTGQTMSGAVRELDADFQETIRQIKLDNPHDVLVMTGSCAAWTEVLAVYAVRTTTDPLHGQEVATVTAAKKELLRTVYWTMNEISYHTETVSSGEDGESSTTYLYLTVSGKTAAEMAAVYGFDSGQQEQLAALLSEENSGLWGKVLFGAGTGTGSGDIVAAALSQLGNVGGAPYWSWYGFPSRVEWCACFVSWCADQCGYIDAGVFPKFAGCVLGAQWFQEHGLWRDNSYVPRPGDIIFFDWRRNGRQDGVTDHVGIVERTEDGMVYTIEGNSGNRCRQRSYPLGDAQIYGYGTPVYERGQT